VINAIESLFFPLSKAEYLLSRESLPGVGGDKQQFWRRILGFDSPESVRDMILTTVKIEDLQLVGQDQYGDRYQAINLIQGKSGIFWRVKTAWIVRSNESIARFVTAIPDKKGGTNEIV
jgi:hypothetical protein